MMRRPALWRRPRMEAGQCPVCEWWFDGVIVGAGDPTGDTAPIVEWAVDARRFGRCLKHECAVRNHFEAPALDQPPAEPAAAAVA